MSQWTHVIGVIKVDTPARNNEEAMNMAEYVTNGLPKITGSEGNISTYLNPCYDSIEQTSIIITWNGQLRDRTFKQTLLETIKTLTKLSERLWIANCLVSVSALDSDQKYIFDNPQWLLHQYQNYEWLLREYPDNSWMI